MGCDDPVVVFRVLGELEVRPALPDEVDFLDLIMRHEMAVVLGEQLLAARVIDHVHLEALALRCEGIVARADLETHSVAVDGCEHAFLAPRGTRGLRRRGRRGREERALACCIPALEAGGGCIAYFGNTTGVRRRRGEPLQVQAIARELARVAAGIEAQVCRWVRKKERGGGRGGPTAPVHPIAPGEMNRAIREVTAGPNG